MHSPPRPVSAKDQADWKIPACISNWKNSKGYTIPLDKRLAADGRGLVETQINDGFAKLSEALYVAESRAREAVETRAKIQRELLAKEKDRKEDELRQLAMAARLARGGVTAPATSLPPPPPLPAGMSRPRAMDYDGDGGEGAAHGAPAGGYPPPPPMPPPGGYPPPPPRGGGGRDGDASDSDGPGGLYAPEAPGASETAAEKAERLRRDDIREERRRERERERRLEARDAHGGKRSKLTRDRDRDVSERIALGQAAVGGARGAESMYDQRLFNQDAGIDSGFGPDDGYNTFSKPLFADRGNSIYQPGRGAAGDAEVYGGEAAPPPGAGEEAGDDALRGGRFKPDRGFAGAEAGAKAGGGGRVGGPVAFERPPEDDDPFGLGQFITDVRKGGGGDKAAPGRPGAMAAAAGGGDGAASGRSKVDFKSGGR
jgi:SNW domain-containing protein 1